MAEFEKEEKQVREENLRLQRRLQIEMERREALCRHLSESESSLEMEEERVVNEIMLHGGAGGGGGGAAAPSGPVPGVHRTRTLSSPIPVYPGQPPSAPSPSPSLSRPMSPGLNYGERRESGGGGVVPMVLSSGAGVVPMVVQPQDSFAPPPALARFHHSGVLLPNIPITPCGPRSLPPRSEYIYL